MSRAAGKDEKVYITEIGWPSHDVGYDEDVVAAYLSRYYLLARSKPYINGVWWYDLYDDGTDSSNREHRFGLIDRAGREKPTFRSFASTSRLLRDTRSVELDDKGDSVQIRLHGEKKRIVYWSAISIPGQKRPLIDYMGSAAP
ncbi:MAG: hypothetical protein P4M11_03140, partial [Candidatus Pacebacteria bacterium]|nr:hypothetical protein [Candidatus Paceibacterota bacterium]